MIVRTSQLKTKIKNLSNGNSNKAQALLRTFFMERFLERLCNSDYKNNSHYVGELSWKEVNETIQIVIKKMK